MTFWAGLLVLAVQGCGSGAPSGSGTAGAATGGGSAGTASAAGASGLSALGGSGGAGLSGASGTNVCPERPVAQRTGGSLISLPLHLVLQGKPLRFGEENALNDGSSLVPMNVRFYLSEVMLQRATGGPLPVDVVSATGSAMPYGVHFYNAEQPESETLHVLAPAGDYTGLSFLVGLKLDCNRRRPESSNEPLTQSSQMSWPHTGFLFLRYEARYTAPAGSDAEGSSGNSGTSAAGSGAGVGGGSGSAGTGSAGIVSTLPTAIHMGGNLEQEVVPRVTVVGAFSVPASGTLEKRLRMDMDEVLRAATASVGASNAEPGLPLLAPELAAGEQLRKALPSSTVFTFEP